MTEKTVPYGFSLQTVLKSEIIKRELGRELKGEHRQLLLQQ